MALEGPHYLVCLESVEAILHSGKAFTVFVSLSH